ncbi:hypothetical protein HK096_006267, partial [Nowakowskiella sp. JEL0078]
TKEDWPGYLMGGILITANVVLRILLDRLLPEIHQLQSIAITSIVLSASSVVLISSLDIFIVSGWTPKSLSQTSTALAFASPLFLQALIPHLNYIISADFGSTTVWMAIVAAIGVSLTFTTGLSSLYFIFGDWSDDSEVRSQSGPKYSSQGSFKIVPRSLRPASLSSKTLILSSLLMGAEIVAATVDGLKFWDLVGLFGVGVALGISYGGVFLKTKSIWPAFLSCAVYFFGYFLERDGGDEFEIGGEGKKSKSWTLHLALAAGLTFYGLILSRQSLKKTS